MPPRIDLKKPLKPTFIKEWREKENISQDRLVERVRELVDGFSKASLSRLENGKQPYSQPILEAIAISLGCEPVNLLRPPTEPENELAAYVLKLSAAKQRQALRLIRAMVDEEAA